MISDEAGRMPVSPLRMHMFRLRLRPDKVAEYERIHATTPQGLDEALRRAGARRWTIWRSGTDVFQCIETDDPVALGERLTSDPSHIRWQERLAGFFEGPADGPLPLIWSLPAHAILPDAESPESGVPMKTEIPQDRHTDETTATETVR